MPKVSVVLKDVQQSVFRPIIFDVVDQIKRITRISEISRILFAGDQQRLAQPGTTIDGTSHDAFLPNQRLVFVEVEEDFDNEAVGTTASYRKEQIPVFLDNLGVEIKPIYATTNVTINIKFRSPSKTEASAWRDDMRVRISQLRDVNLHEFTYHYLLPLPYLTLLQDIHYCRENVAGYQELFPEYVTKYATDRLTVIGDMTNKDTRLAISEKQTRVIGLYGFDTIPDKPEWDESLGVWTIGFSYKFGFEKPIECEMSYPIMIHNQLLPPDYTIFDSSQIDFERQELSYTHSLKALSFFEAQTQLEHYLNPSPRLTLPEHDDYVLKSELPGSATAFTILTELDLSDTTQLFNLREIHPLTLDTDVLDFILQSEYPYIGQMYKSILQLNLYINDRMMWNPGLLCDSLGNVTAPKPLNPRDLNRVRFAIVTDLSRLDSAAIDRLRKYPKALVKTVQYMNELLRDHPGVASLGSRRYISQNDFNAIYRVITGLNYNSSNAMSGQNFGLPGASPNRNYPSNEASILNNRLDPLRDIRGMTLEQLRANRTQTNTVMSTYVVDMMKSQ